MSFTKMHIVGRLWEDDGSSFLAKVPILSTTIPEIPDAVIVGSRCYTLLSSSPLQYNRVTCEKATRIE